MNEVPGGRIHDPHTRYVGSGPRTGLWEAVPTKYDVRSALLTIFSTAQSVHSTTQHVD